MAKRRTLPAWRLGLGLAVLAIALSANRAPAQDRPKIEIVPQIFHTNPVAAVAFSPDGARMLSGSSDLTLKLWDAATGALIRTFEGHSNLVSSVAFSPDGARVLSGSFDNTLKLWDAATGALIRTFNGHSAFVTSVAFSSDGTRVLSGSLDKTLKLWSAATDALIRTFEGHSAPVTSVAFSPDDARVLSGSDDDTLKLWDAATGALTRTFERHAKEVTTVAFSPDGARVLSGSKDKTLKLWDAVTGALIRTFEGHSKQVTSVAFSPDGTRVLSGSFDRTLKLWDATTGGLIRTLEGRRSDPVYSAAFSRDGARVLSGSSRTLKLWDAATGTLIRAIQGHSLGVASVAFSPDGAHALSGDWGRTLKLWDAATGALIRTFEGHSNSVTSVAFSPDGARVLSGGSDKRLKLWDATTGALIHTFTGHSDPVYSVAFSRDGARVLSGSDDDTLKLWDPATGVLIRTFEGHSNSVRSVAFSPDGTRVLSGSRDKTLRLWDAATGALIRTFEGHSDPVTSVAFSPDGARVVSGSWDNTLKLWDPATGALIRTFAGHSNWISSVAFSPDGARVLSGSYDNTLKLWDVATGALIRTFEGHSNWVLSVAFSPNGARVLSGSRDTTVRLWNARSGELLTTSIGGRNQEWLTITQRGFFAASGKGARLLSASRGLEVMSIAQVFDHLYRPDLVEEILKGDPEGKYKDEAFQLNLQKILDSGPAPQIEHLKERDAGAGDTYRLAVRLTDIGGGIGDKVIWRVRNQVRAVSSARIMPGAATDKAVTVTAGIPVDPSQDTLVEVAGYNGAGLLTTLPYRIRIDRFGATTEERPRMYVLAIGVSKYRMPDYELKLAAKDATAFGSALKQVGGGLFGADKVFVKTLLDEQVTGKGIEAAFDEIAARAKLGDVFVLYVSGHGKSVAGRYYYYPQTLDFAGGQRVEQDGIGQDALQAWIARVAAQKKVLIIDTCESSAAAGLIRGGTSTRRTAMDQLQHATGENLIAAARQAAFEGWQGHGVLTYALLEAMNTKEGSDERIKVAGLASYVDERVPEISQRLTGLYQKPTYRLSGSDFPIGVRQTVLTEDTSISSTPTHVLVRNARVREQAAADALGERELSPGTQVRVLKFEGAWALVARDGQKLGFVPVESLVQLQ